MDGALTLARSGLINHADQKTADLLGFKKDALVGKPLTLFVERVDLVVYFSHWNELLSSGKTQIFELALKHKENTTVYASMECRVANRNLGNNSEYLLVLNEVTENRLVSNQLQYQQDLLALIFNTTEQVLSVTDDHFDVALTEGLKKICLFTQSDRSFIYHINRPSRCLELAYQWCQPACTEVDDMAAPTCLPLRQIKRTMVRFLQEQAYIVDDMDQLPAVEREELLNWHQADFGAVICHIVRTGKQPTGIIGVAKTSADGEWPADAIALVKFFGQMVSGRLPITGIEVEAEEEDEPAAEQTAPAPEATASQSTPIAVQATSQQAKAKPEAPPEKPAAPQPAMKPRNVVDMSRPMQLEKITDHQSEEQETVFARDDGVVMLTCPKCSHQESVLLGWFEKLGNAIRVNCPCTHQFAAILEKRRAFRKIVQLDGFFSLKNHLEEHAGQESIGGPMVVKDLSKKGLRFASERSDLLHIGDLVMVRFNLDNTNQALIHKPAKVVAITGNEVGCQFEGDDSYDITLGFYFL